MTPEEGLAFTRHSSNHGLVHDHPVVSTPFTTTQAQQPEQQTQSQQYPLADFALATQSLVARSRSLSMCRQSPAATSEKSY